MNPTHERLFAVLAELSKLCPEWRIGQMVCNLTNLAKMPTSAEEAAGVLWDIEDDELLAAAEEYLENRRRSLQSSNEPAA